MDVVDYRPIIPPLKLIERAVNNQIVYLLELYGYLTVYKMHLGKTIVPVVPYSY